MSKERIVNTKFWTDNYITILDPIEKLLFLYFITNPLTNISGIYELPLKQIAFDTGIESDMVRKIFDRFERDGKIFYRDGWVGIRNFIKNQHTSSTDVQKGIAREIKLAPEQIKIATFGMNYREGGGRVGGVSHILNLTKPNLTKLIVSDKSESKVKEVIDFFYELVLKEKGFKPKILGGADGKVVKSALKELSLEEIKKIMTWYITTPKFTEHPTIRASLTSHSISLYRQQGSKNSWQEL